MSEYLYRTPRTEQEALTDIRATKIKHLKAIGDRMIKLCKEMQKTAEKINQACSTKHWCGD